MKFCTKCGTKLNDDCNFCPKCGQAVNSSVVSDITPEPAVETEKVETYECEQKVITITELAEKTILDQEALFGWKMKDKSPAGKFLRYKYAKYTLVREGNKKDISQHQIEIENSWNNEFARWNKFLLKGLKTYYLLSLLAIIGIFIGLIILVVSTITSSGFGTGSIIGIGVLLFGALVSLTSLITILTASLMPLKRMDSIAKNMRAINPENNK